MQIRRQDNVNFTARWPDVRKVIAALPNTHSFFRGPSFTVDNKTIATKEVVLARLDKFANIVKEKINGQLNICLGLPNFMNLIKSPTKFFTATSRLKMVSEYPYSASYPPEIIYPFKRTIIEIDPKDYRRKTSLITFENDSVEDVTNWLTLRGRILRNELEKAKIEKPEELIF